MVNNEEYTEIKSWVAKALLAYSAIGVLFAVIGMVGMLR